MNTSHNSQLSVRIMRRVHLIHGLRRLAAPFGLRFFLLLGAATPVFAFVSIRQVVANMPSLSDAGAFYDFAASAVQNTETSVQIAVIGVLTLGLFTLRDLLEPRLQTA